MDDKYDGEDNDKEVVVNQPSVDNEALEAKFKVTRTLMGNQDFKNSNV